LLDPPLLDAFGFAPPPPGLAAAMDLALRARRRVVRLLPARRGLKPVRERWTIRSYPGGYRIDGLGPDRSG
jgi:hypothetical protein